MPTTSKDAPDFKSLRPFLSPALLRGRGAKSNSALLSDDLVGRLQKAMGESFRALHAIAQSQGRVAVSLRDATEHDPPGVFYRHSAAAVQSAAAAAGLILLASGEDRDSLGRSNVVWRW